MVDQLGPLTDPMGRVEETLRQRLSLNIRSYFGKWIPISIVVGILAGTLAMVFMVTVNDLWEFGEAPKIMHDPLYVIMPAIGGLIVGVMLHIWPRIRDSGTDNVLHSYHYDNGWMRIATIPLAAIASIVTMGFGGSAGVEGPVAEIGGGTSSGVSRLLHLRPGETRTLLIVGMAAGFSAALKAPLGGAIFALELPYRDSVDSKAFIPSIVASVVSYLVVVGFTGSWSSILDAGGIQPVENLDFLPYIVIVGVIVGVVGNVFIRLMGEMSRRFSAWDVPIYYRTTIAGLVVGCIGLVVPEVLGLGEGTLDALLVGTISGVGLLTLILMGKLVATSITLGSGQLGGILFPCLIMGGAIGGLVAELMSLEQPLLFVIVGMGAMIACVPKTPVAAPILTTEMAGSFTFLIPMLIASVISYVVSGPRTIFSEQRDRLSLPRRMSGVSGGRVAEHMSTDVVSMRSDMTVDEAFKVMLDRHHSRYPLLDEGGRLIGVIDREDVFQAIDDHTSSIDSIAQMFFTRISADRPVEDALGIMGEEGGSSVIIVSPEDEDEVVGILSMVDILRVVGRQR